MRAGVARAPTRRVSPSTAAWIGLAVLLAAAAVLLVSLTRDTTLWRDEWTWALYRRGNTAGTFLEPHYGHLSLVPIALYRLLFATAGLDHYLPYRLLVIGAHLGCATLVFLYARRRVGAPLALVPAALLTFFGPTAQNFIWPFQVGWLISLGAGVAALLMLDRRDRLGDIAASALLAVSLGSSALGIPIALGLAVDVLWGRRNWRHAWIVGAPLVLYGLWWIRYQTNETERWGHDVYLTPSWVFSAPADALSSLVGLGGGATIDGPQSALTWGAPLGLIALAAIVWRLTRLREIPPRVLTLITIPVAFWVLTALGRAFFGAPSSGRYVYVGGLFILLLAAELARGLSVQRRTALLVAVVTAAAVLSNVSSLRDAAHVLRLQGSLTRAELGTLEIARPLVDPGYVSEGFLFDEIVAGPYFAARDELGSPAATPAEIAADPEPIRASADSQLVHIHGLSLQPSSGAVALGARPVLDSASSGTTTEHGACLSFEPAAFAPAAAPVALQVTVPAGGILVRAEGGAATVAIRRFAAAYPAQALGTVHASGAATLHIGADGAPQSWHVRVTPTERATVCGLG
jgi:hypothetical protein